MKVRDFLQRQVRRLSAKGNARWVRRIIFWGAFTFIIRYPIIESFYKDTEVVMAWVSAGLITQTMFVYYFFGYYVLPKYLYRIRLLPFLSILFITHVVLYQSNYFLLEHVQQINVGTRVERDWKLFHDAGVFGFISSSAASFYSFFYSTSFALPFLGFLAVRDIVSYRTRNLQLEKDKLNLELDFLKAQINPHFLFNTLNSVYARIFDSDEQAANLILQLSELMRYNLYETDQPEIALDKELSYIQNYLDLERNRLADQNVVIDYQQAGDPSAYRIAPLLLIAFVENAFKHGVKGVLNPAYVQVTAEVSQGELRFTVENSIPPKRLEAQVATRSGGVGLDNVRRRLDALYADRYTMTVTATDDTYAVNLNIRVELVR